MKRKAKSIPGPVVEGSVQDNATYKTTPLFKAPAVINDPVNHPAHYTDGKIEVIDFIEDKNLGFHLGNSVKYIARAGKKDPAKEIQDLEKAKWYLERRINNLKNVEARFKAKQLSDRITKQ
jgi:Protein of unknwon function (DUF3310)